MNSFDPGHDGTTMTEVLTAYSEGGFTESFTVTEDAQLECHVCDARSPGSEVSMSSLRRLEGESDPDDMVAVVAVTCPACGAQGTLVLGFGPMSTAEDAQVLRDLQDDRGDRAAPGNSAPGEAHGDESPSG